MSQRLVACVRHFNFCESISNLAVATVVIVNFFHASVVFDLSLTNDNSGIPVFSEA